MLFSYIKNWILYKKITINYEPIKCVEIYQKKKNNEVILILSLYLCAAMFA